MPICIECRYPVKTLYTEYSGADDRSTGHGVRLTVCKNCGRFCDKYVEHDFVVLFIDLVLIKPQVYRHLLHNTLMREHDQFDLSIIRLGVLLLLFDVYLTWARIEKQTSSNPEANGANNNNFILFAQQPIVSQYIFFRRPIQTRAWISLTNFSGSLRPFNFIFPPLYTVPHLLSALSTRPLWSQPTILPSELSQHSTACLILYETLPDINAARSLGWAVVANNVEALKILLDCGYGTAVILATVGAISRWLVGRGILWVAGLDGVDTVGDSGVAADGKALWAVVELAREWGGRLGLG
ncbi:Arv1-like family protein [Venustampulla echinocandica]|uniref:Protein ARV n=1 Tax=Venustampulla echinocandica TaxID=2656787 RepID=A0A370TFM8_9HELO|nr:Arv1-like family protein [Venustampulla echinocandica]RDL33700.1 Arv1-like family protein [Venustampulla echinocandica]